jgi:hypothetical protein
MRLSSIAVASLLACSVLPAAGSAQSREPAPVYFCVLTLANGQKSLHTVEARDARQAAQVAMRYGSRRAASASMTPRSVRECVPRLGGQFSDPADQSLIQALPM